jgi:hypothetical protein
MDAGIPWAIVAAIATPATAAVGWISKKLWGLLEGHAERRTKAFEAIAPSIQKSFEKMQEHVTAHADEHAKTVKDAEANIVGVVNAVGQRVISEIGVSQRLERVEAALSKEAAAGDPISPERFESRPPAHASGVQRLRPSRPGATT